jgi:hypothetical protein
MAITPFPDSPRNGAWGDRPYALIDWAGPSSYVQVTNDNTPPITPPTGGQAIGPSNFGLTAGLEGIFVVGSSLSGAYTVQAFQAGSGYNQGSNNATWLLRWLVAATGAEVAASVNLSTEIVRLIGFGPY